MKLQRKVIATEAECPRCARVVALEVWDTVTPWPYCFFEKHECVPKIKENEMIPISMDPDETCCEKSRDQCCGGTCPDTTGCDSALGQPPTQTISNVGGMLAENFSPPQYPPPVSGAAVCLEAGRAWLYYDENRALRVSRDGVDTKVLDFNLGELAALGEWLKGPPVSEEEGFLYVVQMLGAARPVHVVFEDGREVDVPENALLQTIPLREVRAQVAKAAAEQADGGS